MLNSTMITGFRANKDLPNKIDLISNKVNKKQGKVVYLAGNNVVFVDTISKEQIILNGTEDTEHIVTFDISNCRNFLVVSEKC